MSIQFNAASIFEIGIQIVKPAGIFTWKRPQTVMFLPIPKR